MFHKTFFTVLVCTIALVGCGQIKMSKAGLREVQLFANAQQPLPAMRWDHLPQAAAWTTSVLAEIRKNDAALASRVPADIQNWCPKYETASMSERRAFWAGLLSAIAKYESNMNANASGGRGRYIGLMQISPKSAANYGCTAVTQQSLKDANANLQCAVKIIAVSVGKDGEVAGTGKKGVGRDWMPLRNSKKRAAMMEYTATQEYCR
jgi:hypothetical protein